MTMQLLLLPCATFFSAGRTKAGILALLLQLSLVFWPVAVKQARICRKQMAIASKLAEYSSKYELPKHALWDRRRFRTESETALAYVRG